VDAEKVWHQKVTPTLTHVILYTCIQLYNWLRSQVQLWHEYASHEFQHA